MARVFRPTLDDGTALRGAEGEDFCPLRLEGDLESDVWCFHYCNLQETIQVVSLMNS